VGGRRGFQADVVIILGIGNARSRSIVENCAAAFIIFRAVVGCGGIWCFVCDWWCECECEEVFEGDGLTSTSMDESEEGVRGE
jgi:hypothetical protein